MGRVVARTRSSLLLAALVVGLAASAGERADDDAESRREAELELKRREAQLERIRERLRQYREQLDGAAPDLMAPPGGQRPDATLLVRSDTDAHGRAVFAIEAGRATLQSVLEALTAEARLDLLVDEGVSHRDVASLVTVALDGVTFREALDLLLGRFDLEYTVGEGHVAVAPPTKLAFRTAEERLRHEAEQAYLGALVRFPDHPDAPRAHLLLGQHFVRRGLHPQAVEHLERLLRDYPRSEHVAAARFTLGQAYEALGDLARSADAHRQVVSDHAQSPLADDALLALARRAIADGKPSEALPLLGEIVKQHPDGDARPEAEVLLAETLLATKRYDTAIDAFERLLARGLSPEAERRVRLLLARALAAQGHAARARQAAYELRRRFPDTPEGRDAYYLLADTYYGEDGPESYLAAVEAYRGAVRRAPDGPQAEQARMRLATLYQRMTVYDLAIRDYEKLLADSPQSPYRRHILQALGECYRERGNYQKARFYFERAAEGGDAQAWHAALLGGRAALDDGRPADAIPVFQRIARGAGDPTLAAEAHEALGDCYRRLGRLEEALAAYQRAAATPAGEAPGPPNGTTREPNADQDTQDTDDDALHKTTP